MIFNLLNNQLEKMLNKILIKTVYGKISITIPSGKKIIFSGSQEGAETEIIIKRFSIVKKILKSGSIGFAEAYIDNDFSTKDLSSLLVFAKQNEKFYHELIKGKKIYNLLRKISHKMNENTQKNSKKNISYHYDLGNDFYKLWLDKSMTYSSALFNSNIDCLEKAQINKFRNLTQSMNL